MCSCILNTMNIKYFSHGELLVTTSQFYVILIYSFSFLFLNSSIIKPCSKGIFK